MEKEIVCRQKSDTADTICTGFELGDAQSHTARKPKGMQIKSNQKKKLQITAEESLHRMHSGLIQGKNHNTKFIIFFKQIH